MKHFNTLLGAAALCLVGMQAHAADITVTITGVSSDAGTVRAALHDGAEGFPRERQMVAGVFVEASAGAVTLVFEDVPAGRYAISAFHDQDGDNALSANLLGIPNEPFGFSNDARGSFGPPEFEDAAFEVSSEDISLTFTFAN